MSDAPSRPTPTPELLYELCQAIHQVTGLLHGYCSPAFAPDAPPPRGRRQPHARLTWQQMVRVREAAGRVSALVDQAGIDRRHFPSPDRLDRALAAEGQPRLCLDGELNIPYDPDGSDFLVYLRPWLEEVFVLGDHVGARLERLAPGWSGFGPPPKSLPAGLTAHGPDFRCVRWFGTLHIFTPKQAKCVELLWEAWERGTPVLGQAYILTEARYGQDDTTTLRDVFERGHHAAWDTMIQSSGKGAYRLAEPKSCPGAQNPG